MYVEKADYFGQNITGKRGSKHHTGHGNLFPHIKVASGKEKQKYQRQDEGQIFGKEDYDKIHESGLSGCIV